MSIATSFTPSKSLLSNWVVESLEGLLAAPIAHVCHVPLHVTDHRHVLVALLERRLVHADVRRRFPIATRSVAGAVTVMVPNSLGPGELLLQFGTQEQRDHWLPRLADGRDTVWGGAWGAWHPTWLLGHEIHGTTLGIVGPGRIGTAVARRAQGFDMRVLYYGRREAPDFPGESVALDDLLSESDFVSVHTPLSEQTAGMFGTHAFATMPPRAIFVNTARGGIVDQPALREALITGRIAAAAIDVTTPEPLPPDDPLLEAPNLLVTPHVGSATGPTRERMAGLAVDGLLAALTGERPQHLVNPEAWRQHK